MLTPHSLSTPTFRCHQDAFIQIACTFRTRIHSRVNCIEAGINSGDYDVIFAGAGVHGEAEAVGFGPVIFVGGFVAPVLVAPAVGFVEDPVDHGLGFDG